MKSRKDLYFNTRCLWPDNISIRGQTIEEQYLSGQELLNIIYNGIEQTFDDSNDWMQISAWSFHQALSTYSKGKDTNFSIKDVPFELYEEMMLENLNGDECWEVELKIYESLKSS